jgi:hypothetical protein
MKKMKYILLISLLVLSSSCVTKPRIVKSPCVDNQYSDTPTPCIRRPVNNKWLA